VKSRENKNISVSKGFPLVVKGKHIKNHITFSKILFMDGFHRNTNTSLEVLKKSYEVPRFIDHRKKMKILKLIEKDDR
jgi:hypothetical protein